MYCSESRNVRFQHECMRSIEAKERSPVAYMRARGSESFDVDGVVKTDGLTEVAIARFLIVWSYSAVPASVHDTQEHTP